jgi:predicted nucleic acid-binding protein
MPFTSDRFFVDTNVLVYAHDLTAGAKHDRARDLVAQLWRDRTGVLSTQVLQELYVRLRKTRNPLPAEEARQIVADYLRWDIVGNTGDSVLAAVDLELRYRLSFWDALIVHAASASGAEILYSEDLSDGQAYGTVRVVNPLVP